MSWVDEVEEHRETIERWADSDLPLAEEMRELLEEADAEGGGTA